MPKIVEINQRFMELFKKWLVFSETRCIAIGLIINLSWAVRRGYWVVWRRWARVPCRVLWRLSYQLWVLRRLALAWLVGSETTLSPVQQNNTSLLATKRHLPCEITALYSTVDTCERALIPAR